MYNAMLDPELLRLAQEQMSRISPEEMAKMQQQMMANPELVRMATESMKSLRPEDLRRAAEQLKHTTPEDMVGVSEKISKATPEELASMKAHADAQISYEMNAAKMLKQQGNELHSCGQYHDATKKYSLAKSNLKNIPSSMGGTLQLQCSLNLMSCYLKTKQFEDCIKEGSEVLAYDSRNVKAFYRRGQAYRELGNFEAAVSDLNNAHEISPDDETIAAVLRDTKERLMDEGGNRYNASHGVMIEEIIEQSDEVPSGTSRNSTSVAPPAEIGEISQNVNQSNPSEKASRDGSEANRSFKHNSTNSNPSTSENLGLPGISPDMLKTATDMISKMKPEELQKMYQMASSFNGDDPYGSRLGSKFPEMTPEMVKMTSDRLSNMKPNELQEMLKMASSMNGKGLGDSMAGSKFPEMTPEMIKMTSDTFSKMSPEDMERMVKVASSLNGNGMSHESSKIGRDQSPEKESLSSVAAGSPSMERPSLGETNSGGSFLSSSISQSSSSTPASTVDLQESVRNSMRDPAMRQMFTSMIRNMSPDMMASMSEQFGMKLSKEDAEKAQQAMSKLSPEDLDRMMRWAERAQRTVETAKKTKNWLLGRPGMILAIVMLILAFILHQLGFIGG